MNAGDSTRKYGSPSAWWLPTGKEWDAALNLLDVETDLSEVDLGAKEEGTKRETEIGNLLDRGDLNEEQTSELLLRK